MKKRIVSLFLVCMMLLSALCACTAQQTEEPASVPADNGTDSAPTDPGKEDTQTSSDDPDNGEQYDVHIIYRIPPQNEDATEAVVAHINEDILPSLIPNTTISIEFIPADEYIQSLKLMLAGNEKMDLVLSMASYGFADFAAQGAYLPWNDYLAYMPNTMALIPDGWLEGTTVNGEIYGIPNYQITARSHSVSLDNEMLEKYSINPADIKSIADVEEKYFAPLAAGGEYANGSIVNAESEFLWTNSQADVFDEWGLEQISQFLVIDKNDPKTILNFFETDSVADNFRTIKEWVDKGYYSPEKIEGQDYTALWQENRYGTRFDGWQPYWEEHIKNTWLRDMTTIRLTEPLVTTASVRSTMTALASTSENPYRAAKVLDLINSNEELFNAICYGIEGVNYTRNDDGTVTPNAESGYAISTWSYQLGNTMLQYRSEGKQEDFNQQVDELNRSANLGLTFGFSFDNINVQTEIASCNAVIDSYRQGFLYAKYDDVDAALKELNDALYDAGMQNILDEAQSQLDAWYQSK